MNKLTYDPKKIRKGPAIGLPYMGSKRKISKKIIQILKENFPKRPVYDLFGGGGAVTAELALNDYDVTYNDKDELVAGAFDLVLNDQSFDLKTTMISRDEFFDIKKKVDKTSSDTLKLLVNSFGNTQKTYIYDSEISDVKFNLAKDIMIKYDLTVPYQKTQEYLNAGFVCKALEQYNRYLSLNNLRSSNIKPKQILSKSYTEFSGLKNAILYLDPPYEYTAGYEDHVSRKIDDELYQKMRNKLLLLPYGTVIQEDDIEYKLGTSSNNHNRMYYKDLMKSEFDSKSFYDWTFEMSKNNVVIISSYNISDPRFECVHMFDTTGGSFIGGRKKNISKTEKLWMVKN